MGANAALAPEEVSDSNYSERLALFEEQNGFIEALGQQFSQGINGGKPFNGKDLLTEMILSPWFTAAGIEDGVSSTPAAIGNIGARRLLTPEELEAKTFSLLGAKWGDDGNPDDYLYSGIATNLRDSYRSFYGGIDSNGVKDRARALSALMVNVAERQALDMSCSTVIQEFAKPSNDRIVFADIEPEMEPDTDAAATYIVSSDNYEDAKSYKSEFNLLAGEKKLSIGFLNDFWRRLENGDSESSELYINEITISDHQGAIILQLNFSAENHNELDETFGIRSKGCGGLTGDSFRLWGSNCTLDLPLNLSVGGTYLIELSAWGKQVGDDLTELGVFVKGDYSSDQNNGSQKIKSKIVELYRRFHGVELNKSHPNVNSAYELLVTSWEGRRALDSSRTAPYPEESCWWDQWQLASNYENDRDLTGMKYAWRTMLVMLMTDFDYLHE